MDKQLTIQKEHDVAILNKGLPSEHELMVFNTISKQAADSKMYNHYGGQAGIMMTILAARELGIPPMLAINGGISNINGKLEISARLMNAMMRRAGIKISIKESTDERCTLIGQRGEGGDRAEVCYTINDAKLAGLIKSGGGWVKNPKDMCFARAISRLARQIAPDIIGGCYIEGEIKATESAPQFDIAEIEEMILPETNEKTLFDMFPESDHSILREYIQTVSMHFKWSEGETIKKFIAEKSIVDKFNAWKGKRKES